MGDLNLDFDQGTKNISLSNVLNDNLNINKDNDASFFSDPITPTFSEPNLKVSNDLNGVELLAKGMSSDMDKPTVPEKKDNPDEGFSFFKKIEETIDDSSKNEPNLDDEILLNNENIKNEVNDYKPIHKLTPQEIKNEKIDLLYKFKKLEHQGIRTTMNYNMNSHLDDMRNEYIKLKKQREIENSIKFSRKM